MRAAAAAPGGSRSISAISPWSCASAPKKRRRSRRVIMGQKVHPPGLSLGINRSGRLGGAQSARRGWYREGRGPLHALRAEVDFGYGRANTTYGPCGAKVWVFKGEILAHDPMAQDKRAAEAQPTGGDRGRRPDAA